MHCPHCQSANFSKAGFHKKKQRHLCRDCGCHFTQSYRRTYPQEIKEKALSLYLEGLGFRAIGRVLGVSNVTVLNWVRHAEKALPKPEKTAKIEILEWDELWHFVKKRAESSGCGLLLTVSPIQSLTSNSAAVVFSP